MEVCPAQEASCRLHWSTRQKYHNVHASGFINIIHPLVQNQPDI